MAGSLEALTQRYPLAQGWKISDVLEERFELDGGCFSLLGIQARHDSLPAATASAADPGGEAHARCYFELLERTAIFASAFGGGRGGRGGAPLRDPQGRSCGWIDSDALFPANPSERQRYSISNGVACHQTWSQACEAALLELVERDRVLRSWYRIGAPPRRLVGTPAALEPFEGRYRVACFGLDAPASDAASIDVAGAVLFPKREGLPFAAGFAAGRSADHALERAAREAVQRVGFLWGEEISADAPCFEATPEYHLDYFLYPPHQDLVLGWLESGEAADPEPGCPEPRVSEVVYADLTPPHLRGRLSVARALGGGHLPLVFGDGHPALARPPVDRSVHPVA